MTFDEPIENWRKPIPIVRLQRLRIIVLPLKSSLISVIVKMCNPTVCGYLRVDVSTLAFIQINLCLEDVNFLCLTLELCLEQFLLLLNLALLLIVFIDEDLLVRAVQFAIQVELFFTQRSDQIQQICVSLDALSQLTLCLL